MYSTTKGNNMKYHLIQYVGIKADGKTLVTNNGKYSKLFSSCGNDINTRSTMGNLGAIEFLNQIKREKESGWYDESICKKCESKLYKLIDEGKKIRQAA